METPDRLPPATPPTRRPLFAPTPAQVAATQLSAFIQFCGQRAGRDFADYPAFERFCIENAADFWQWFLEWSALECEGSSAPSLVGDQIESTTFFPNVRLSYAENLLRIGEGAFEASRPAITAVHADRPTERWTRGELRDRAQGLSAALLDLGLGSQSRIAIVANNTPWAIAGCLGAAGIGCTVSTGALDVGSAALISRFSQVEPVLLMADLPDPATTMGAQQRARFTEVVRNLPTLRGIVLLDDFEVPTDLGLPVHRASALLARHAGVAVEWPRLAFNHPLFVLFTSGTTGAPKCLVHGAGGTLIEHVKEHRLHCDLRGSDKLFFQTSTGWMMWNWQLSALAVGSEIVLFDGPVTSADRLWRIVADERVTMFGTSPAYLQICERSGWRPGDDFDFSALRAMFSTGSILYPRQQEWVWTQVKPLHIQSISGGTDIVGCFVLGNPNLPAYSAECQSRSLGLDVRSLDAQTEGSVGELVCANPFPSRPLGILGDVDGRRFHKAYFSQNPRLWTHGDLIEFTPEGSARMHGRSDGVLNIRGIRIGPAELYRVLADFPEISESMAVEQHSADEPGGARLVLLLVLKEGEVLSNELAARIKRELGSRRSAAHVPAAILAVDQLPTTFSGKRSERSARDALSGLPIVNAGALRNPESLDPLKAWAARRVPTAAPAESGNVTFAQSIRQAWEDVLEVSPVGPDDNYFDLGGDSLRAMRLVADIKRRTGRDVAAALLFESPTLATFTAALEQRQPMPHQPLVLLSRGRRGPPLFIVHGVGGSVMELRPLVQALQTDRAVYGLQARGFGSVDQPNDRVETMAAEYLAALRSVQPSGPYLLLGYSFGGWVAYEMARILKAAGESVSFLGIMDSTSLERDWPAAAWIEYFGRRLRSGLRTARTLQLRDVIPHWSSRLRSLFRRLVRAMQSAPLPDEVHEVVLSPEFQRVRDAGMAAAAAYRPRESDLAVTLFRSDLTVSHLSDPAIIWRHLTDSVELCDVPGDHRTMIRTPHLEVLARVLSQCLQAQSPLLDDQGNLYESPDAALDVRAEAEPDALTLAAQGV